MACGEGDVADRFPPMISGYDDYHRAIASIVEALRRGDPAEFVYNHLSAWRVRLAPVFGTRIIKVQITYTGEDYTAVYMWEVATTVPSTVVHQLEVEPGHEAQTLTSLFADLSNALGGVYA